MGRGAVVYGWRRGWTRGGGRQHVLDKKRACLATVKSMPCNGGTARGGIGKGAHEGWRITRLDEFGRKSKQSRSCVGFSGREGRLGDFSPDIPLEHEPKWSCCQAL